MEQYPCKHEFREVWSDGFTSRVQCQKCEKFMFVVDERL
jgi:hypothetical protein